MPTASDRRIALLGTGIMGAHMARRLAQAGFPVTVWNRSADKAEKLTQFGVKIADSPSSACAEADVVIVMLSNGPVVEEVLFSPDHTGKKPAEAMAAGSVLVVMSSIPVETCQAQAPRLAARGVGYIDAPVSGGEPGARDGTLAIMAGGDADVGRRHRRCVRRDGTRHAYRSGRHRTDDKARQPDHRRRHHGRGCRSPALCHQGRRRSGRGAQGPDGRLCRFQNSQHPRRTHGRAEFRAGRTGGIPAQGYANRAGARGRLRHAFHAAGLPGRDVRRHDRRVRHGPRRCRHPSGSGAALRRRAGGEISQRDRHDRPRHAHHSGRHRPHPARSRRQDERDHAGNVAGIAERLPRHRRRTATFAS